MQSSASSFIFMVFAARVPRLSSCLLYTSMELDVAIRAVENGALKPPRSTIAGIRTAPSAATVAGPDPEIAPKKQATITHTMAMPPLLCPTQVSTNLTSLLEIPAFAMIFPESTKNGIARRRNLLIPAYILVATMVREVPEYRIAPVSYTHLCGI